MKKLLLLALFICANCFGQLKIEEDSGLYVFKKIDSIHLAKKELKTKTKVWFAKTFNDSKSVIRLDDENQIIGKGNFDINYTSSGYPLTSSVDFTITISFKEGKYRFEMENFSIKVASITNPLEFYVLNSTFESFKTRIFKYVEKMPEDQKKMTLKYYKKEKNLKKGFEAMSKVSNSVINRTNKEVEYIYSSFQRSIKSKKDDW